MSRIAIFPGSFDPFTKGHEDIVNRSIHLFDQVIIAIGHNTKKQRYFDVNHMRDTISDLFAQTPQVNVVIYEELTSDLAKKNNANFLIRGLRNTTDYEYESAIAHFNKDLNDQLETVFLITSPQLAHISSSIVREVHRHGGDVSKFLPFDL